MLFCPGHQLGIALQLACQARDGTDQELDVWLRPDDSEHRDVVGRPIALPQVPSVPVAIDIEARGTFVEQSQCPTGLLRQTWLLLGDGLPMGQQSVWGHVFVWPVEAVQSPLVIWR